MAKLLKLRRGTTTQHASFTGAEGEVTIDTTKDTAVVHDGSQAGGRPLAREDMSNVSSASIAGRLGTDSISVDKIAAGTLPNDVKVNSNNIINQEIVNEDVSASAAIANSKLADSGVTAGAYGSSSAIPIVTVNAKGVVTAASTTAIDSTKIQNGTSEVSVANNANITIKRGGTNIVNVSGGGIGITGDMSITGNVDGVDIAALKTSKDSLSTTNGALVNGVTATTQAASDSSTKVATTAYVKAAITGYNFPSGTKMIFQQTSAPTGWTKITSSVNNKALRVVSGTAGSGGSNAFSNTLADRSISANAGNTTAGGNVSSSAGNTTAGGNVSVSVANATQGGNISVGNTTAGGNLSISSVSTSGTVNSHTLSVGQMPSHGHYLPTANNVRGEWRSGGATGFINLGYKGNANTGGGTAGSAGPTQYSGSSQGHSHGFSGSSHNHTGSLSGTAHNHNASFSGSAHSHNASGSFSGNAHNHNVSSSFSGTAHNHSISVGNLNMAVQYLDVIIASKD